MQDLDLGVSGKALTPTAHRRQSPRQKLGFSLWGFGLLLVNLETIQRPCGLAVVTFSPPQARQSPPQYLTCHAGLV